ncbi:hypothetical protein GTQ99_03220 [Kineococcus sp. T13]|uniref:hypothetical protein n=1 Tax=Kineococcus vitellinus TaxID=2696565 RepID=UPI001412B6E9|nr:hypothetical protein [Kineococcus vitellinus]NAZ74435.1 hypothetical protein [Kineococcus vitellinus]
MTIEGRDVVLRAEGRTEVYDLAYVRMLVPYLRGERDLPPMRLAHFRPGMKPWICLSVIADDGSEPDLSGVAIYSGLGTHREMGLHLSRSEAWRLAEMLQPVACELEAAEPERDGLDGDGLDGDGLDEGEQERAA